MIEDKLTREERIRLECLAQAVSVVTIRGGGATVVLETAGKFEKFIMNDEDE